MNANAAICTAIGLIVSSVVVASVYGICEMPISILSYIKSTIGTYSKAKYRSRKVMWYLAIINRDPLFSISSYMHAYANLDRSKFNTQHKFRHALIMCRKYLDRDLIRAIRIANQKDNDNGDIMGWPRLLYSNLLFSYVPDAHLTSSIEKFQRRLKMLDDIRQQPERLFKRKLLYLTTVLGCDTPIIEAIHYSTISSILPEKN